MDRVGRGSSGSAAKAPQIEVIRMWWVYIIVAGLLVFAGYAFVSLVRFRTEMMTRKTDRTAEDLYDRYADGPSSGRRARRLARKHQGG
jgi:uncharacterized membrane protein